MTLKKTNDPDDYELEEEYDLSQMTVLPRGRYDSARPATFLAFAPHSSTLAQVVGDIVASVPQVLLVYLFGSQALADTGPMSDLDLAVLLTHTALIAPAQAELESGFSAFSSGIPLDLIILNQAPIELAYSVISQGKVLYQRSVADRVEYEANVMSRYGDYLPFLRGQRKDILEGTGNDRRVQRYREALGRTQRTLSASGTAQGTAPR